MERKNVKPFLKWAGGKTQLIDKIHENAPVVFNKFIDAFVGGGSVFLSLYNIGYTGKIIINDINKSLMRCYLAVKFYPDKVVSKLDNLITIYINQPSEIQKEEYLKARVEFNRIKKEFLDFADNKEEAQKSIDLAVYFIFLNKTCFNGIYRENKKGEFNVPWGSYKKRVMDTQVIIDASLALQNVELYSTDFENLLSIIDNDTFIYLDPPYRPISKTSTFNTYNSGGFSDDEQRRLKTFCDNINSNGGKFLLSNSACNDYFFEELYENYNMEYVSAKRMINSVGTKRGEINELMFWNYVDF